VNLRDALIAIAPYLAPFAPHFLRFIAIRFEDELHMINLATVSLNQPKENIMLQKFIEAEKVIAMSLAVLVTGLTVGGIAELADSEYNRAEAVVKQEMAQRVAAVKLSTRSGNVNA
jgi:hypothetical protein